MTDLVLDASAALALLLDQPARTAVHDALRDAIVRESRILVASTFWTDVLDGLGQRPAATLVEAVYELDQLGLEVADTGQPGVLAAVDAIGRGASARAAAALVLAEAVDAWLLTADPSLAAAAGERAILAGGRRPRARRPDRSWARWKGAAAYLRELRATLG